MAVRAWLIFATGCCRSAARRTLWLGPRILPAWRAGPMPAEAAEYLDILWAARTAIISIKNPQPGSALARRRSVLAAQGYTDKFLPEGPRAVARALGVSPPNLDILSADVILDLDGTWVVALVPIWLIKQAIAAVTQPADPPRYCALHVYLAQPSRLLAAIREIYAGLLDAAVVEELLRELWRALKAGQIRHEVDIGSVYWPLSLALARDPIDGRPMLTAEQWNLVDPARGVLEHPMGVARPIKACEEDVVAHFGAWWRRRQEQSSASQPEAAQAKSTEPEAEQHWTKAVNRLVRLLRKKQALVRQTEFEDACTGKLHNCTYKAARVLYADHIRAVGLGAPKGAQSVANQAKLARGQTILSGWKPHK